MEAMLKIGGLAVAAALCALLLKEKARPFALAAVLGASAMILALALGAAEEITAMVSELQTMAGLSPAVVAPVLKAVGISILTHLAAQVCKDAGEGGLASAAELAGTVLALCAALPLLRAVLDTVEELL